MLTSTDVTWKIPYIFEMESYTVEYWVSASEHNQVLDVVLRTNDPTQVDLSYSVSLFSDF